MNVLLCIIALLLTGLSSVTSSSCVDKLYESECTNCDVIAQRAGFTDTRTNPFEAAPFTGYDVSIKTNKNCYVYVNEKKTKNRGHLVYSLQSRGNPTDASPGFRKYITHTLPCGVCSDLKSLASYMNYTSLESDVLGCGVTAFISILAANGYDMSNVIQSLHLLNDEYRMGDMNVIIPYSVVRQLKICINEKVNLEGLCLSAWAWSTINAGLNCGGVCLASAYALLPPNIPSPSYDMYPGTNFCDPNICQVTLNEEQVCYPEAYTEGDYRLNSCLQCEECADYALFTKIVGRNRRNSGLPSTAIQRPADVVSDFIVHSYGLKKCPPSWLK